ncbi:alpha/beta hydrolase [Burkholderiaceae bacterium 16]|nr:alpha/beta hydrolase [Burkholderiaceae bacterium 16]
MAILIACIAIGGIVLLGLVVFTGLIAHKVEKALPPKGKFIEIDGARLHYIDKGQGPVIVMVHGLGGQTGNFSHSLLERLTSRFRVILVDRPGSGYSTRPAAMSARLSVQSAVVAKFIRALGVENPLLVGHSLGGAVALGVALDHPGAVGGLALIAPLTHPVEGVPPMFRALSISSATLRRAIAWTWAVPRSILRGRAMLELVFSPDQPPKDFAIAGGGLLGLRPGSFYAASSDMVSVAEDLPGMAQRYASLTLPISILYGTADAVLDWQAHGKAMRDKLPALDLELVPGGHMLPVTIPDKAAAWVTAAAARL